MSKHRLYHFGISGSRTQTRSNSSYHCTFLIQSNDPFRVPCVKGNSSSLRRQDQQLVRYPRPRPSSLVHFDRVNSLVQICSSSREQIIQALPRGRGDMTSRPRALLVYVIFIYASSVMGFKSVFLDPLKYDNTVPAEEEILARLRVQLPLTSASVLSSRPRASAESTSFFVAQVGRKLVCYTK